MSLREGYIERESEYAKYKTQTKGMRENEWKFGR